MTNFGAITSDTNLVRHVTITGDQFRNGVTAPTSVTIGTTPTIPGLLFDATNELASAFIEMPSNWDQTQDGYLTLIWSLVSVETDGYSLDVTLDYTVPVLNSTGDGIDKTSTQVLMVETVTTANGLAINDMYTITALLDANNATNPFSGVSALGFAFEIHLTNVTGVTSMHLLAGDVEYVATD